MMTWAALQAPSESQHSSPSSCSSAGCTGRSPAGRGSHRMPDTGSCKPAEQHKRTDNLVAVRDVERLFCPYLGIYICWRMHCICLYATYNTTHYAVTFSHHSSLRRPKPAWNLQGKAKHTAGMAKTMMALCPLQLIEQKRLAICHMHVDAAQT